jgi:hypothetical protein
VSVLVRSVDRAVLQEALASVALQTWPDIEVVVVAAKPGHRELPASCGPFPLRLVTTDAPLQRSAAANRALDEARGDYLLFLDDDDWLMPGHVARLAETLARQPNALAAYTGVSLANDKGEPVGQAMDLPFDGVRQLAGNLMPIQAVLFHRKLCAMGVRFDEQLDRYEDWDFWLQVARHTTLVHVPGVSAVYRIHDSSGVHAETGATGAAAQRIFEKWQPMWSVAQRTRLMERAWATDDLEARVAGADAVIADLKQALDRQHAQLASVQATAAHLEAAASQQNATIAQQQAALYEQSLSTTRLVARNDELAAAVASRDALVATREAQVTELMNSTSWKVTAPLRRLSRALKRR